MASVAKALSACWLVLLFTACAQEGGGSAIANSSGEPEAEGPSRVSPEDAGEPEPVADDDTTSPPEPEPVPAPEVPSEPAPPEPMPPQVTPPSPAPVPTPPPAEPVVPEPVVAPQPTVGPNSAPDAGTPPEPAPEPDTEPEDWPFDDMNDPIENDAQCPDDEPAAGDPCPAYELVCKYGSEIECRSRWVCTSSGSWYLNYGPRDCPEICPEEEPAEGDPCEVESSVCDYGETPECSAQWLCFEGQWARTFYGDCTVGTVCPESKPDDGEECTMEEVTPVGGRCIYDGGWLCGCGCTWETGEVRQEWYCGVIATGFPPDYLRACPNELPEEGSACGETNTSTCGYPTEDICLIETAGYVLANCMDGEWVHSYK